MSDYIEDLMLLDVWRERNPNLARFTWHRQKPTLMFSRLDFFLVNYGISELITTCDFIPGFRSDNSAIQIVIEWTSRDRGLGIWKMNNSHLENKLYIEKMELELNITKQANINHAPDVRWERLKHTIIQTSVEWSKERARKRNERLIELRQKFIALKAAIDDDNIGLSEDSVLFGEYKVTERLYKDHIRVKTQGTIFRSRVKMVRTG